MENKKAAARATALNQILVQIPGDDSASQCQRVLTALQTLGRVTSPELMVRLKVDDPRSHILELRRHGHRIKTATRAKPTESGVPFRISMYTLEAGTC